MMNYGDKLFITFQHYVGQGKFKKKIEFFAVHDDDKRENMMMTLFFFYIFGQDDDDQ